jgi:hypothetical protein
MSRVQIQPTGFHKHLTAGACVHYDIVSVDEAAGTRYVLASEQKAIVPELPADLQRDLEALLYSLSAHLSALAGLDVEESILERAARDGRPIERNPATEEEL